MRQDSGKEPVLLDCEHIRSTEKASLYKFGDDREVWIPKSQIISEVPNKSIEIPEWLAYKNDLI